MNSIDKYISYTVLHNTVTILLGYLFRPNIQAIIRPTQCLELNEKKIQEKMYKYNASKTNIFID